MSSWIPSRNSTSLTASEVDVEDSTERARNGLRRLGRLPCLDDPRMKFGELEVTARLHVVKDIMNEFFCPFPKFWDTKVKRKRDLPRIRSRSFSLKSFSSLKFFISAPFGSQIYTCNERKSCLLHPGTHLLWLRSTILSSNRTNRIEGDEAAA